MAFESLSEKLSAAFKKLRQKGKLDEKDVKEAMREVRMALLQADVNYKVAKQFVADISQRAVGSEVLESLTPAQQVVKIVNEELIALMGSETARIHFPAKGPCVIMMCGLQGAGKTTHSAKIAKYFKEQGHRPLLVACDVYRPAAIKQLQVVGEQVEVPVYQEGTISPVEIAKHAVSHAKDHGNDIVLLDTAGRLHIDEALMQELQAIKQAVDPTEILLVVDSMTGQDAVNVAESFNDLLSITGVVLTKLDGDSRGGAALSVKAVTGKPIKFCGTGEKLGDVELFHPDRMASRILGMGDMLSFIEKAQAQVDEKKAREMEQKMRANRLDLNDMLDQLEQIHNMGGLQKVLSMMPGMLGGQKIPTDNLDEHQLDKTKAIIFSMTPRERSNPKIINPSRKRRIAAGCGMKVEDVNRLLKQWESMNQMAKQMNNMMHRKKKSKKKRK